MFELVIALGAGLISFLSPCVLPLIPGYISYISGSSLNELIEKKNINLIPIILFTVGFSIVFIIFGAASTFLGQILLQNSFELRIVAGLVIIIFSLHIIGIINIKFLNYEKRIDTNISSNSTGNSGNATQGVLGTYGTLTVAADGSYTYVANTAAAEALDAGDEVTDVFTYTVKDDDDVNSDTATLTITVTGIDNNPVGNNDAGAINEDKTLTVSAGSGVLSNAVSYTHLTLPTKRIV